MRRVDGDHLHEGAFFGFVSRRPDVFERLCEHGLDVRFKDGLDSIEPGRPVLPRRKEGQETRPPDLEDAEGPFPHVRRQPHHDTADVDAVGGRRFRDLGDEDEPAPDADQVDHRPVEVHPRGLMTAHRRRGPSNLSDLHRRETFGDSVKPVVVPLQTSQLLSLLVRSTRSGSELELGVTHHTGRNALHRIRDRTSNSSGFAARKIAGTFFDVAVLGSSALSDMAGRSASTATVASGSFEPTWKQLVEETLWPMVFEEKESNWQPRDLVRSSHGVWHEVRPGSEVIDGLWQLQGAAGVLYLEIRDLN